MAAFLKFPTEKEWEVLVKFLANDGCIIVPPDVAMEISSARGSNITDQQEKWHGARIEYDFGGEADIWVDIAYKDTLSYEAVVEELYPEEGEKENES